MKESRYENKRRRSISPDHRKRQNRRSYSPGDDSERFLNRIDTLIEKVGDSPNLAKEQLEKLSNVLIEESYEHSNRIIDSVSTCITELPCKTKIYAELIHLISYKEPKFPTLLIDNLNILLEENLKNGNWIKMKLILRFLFQLEQFSLFSYEDVSSLLSTFFSKTKEENTTTDIKDSFCYIVISTLPWVSKVSKEFIEEIEDYLDDRNKKKFSSLKGLSKNQNDFLKTIWNQIKKQIQIKETSTGDVEEENFKSLKKFEISIKTDDTSKKEYYRNILSIEDDTISMEDNFFIEEYIFDILFLYNKHGYKECVNALLQINFHDLDINVKIIDIIFSELFLLPNLNFSEVYYFLLICELCERRVEFSRITYRYILYFFDKIEEMDSQIRDRFCSYLAFHLDYFNFQFNWKKFEFNFDDEKKNFKQINFLKDLFEEMLNLSFFEKLIEYIPNSFHSLFPLKKQIDLKSKNEQVIMTMKERKSNFEIKNLNIEKNDLLKSILYLGSTSYSHLQTFIKRYIELIKEMEMNDVLNYTKEFWNCSNQMLKITFEIYVELKVVSSLDLLNWVINQNDFDFDRKFIWDLIFSLLKKIDNPTIELLNSISKKSNERSIELKRKYTKFFIE
eukprot:gene4744-8326_t